MAHKKFPVIRIIVVALRIVAVLVVVSVAILIVGMMSSIELRQQVDQRLIAAVAIAVLGCSVVLAIVLLAHAELLICFTAIEENTRQGKTAVINLQSVVRTAIEEQTQTLEQRLASQSAAQPASLGTCPKCGVQFRVTEKMRGQQAACPKCGAKITI
jgi:hypothetical protein